MTDDEAGVRKSHEPGIDAYAPREIAARVQGWCVAKAQLPLLSLAMLGVLAGAFIGFGALAYTVVASDASLGFAASRLIGGLAFSLGLVLVTVAGGELFTGNNMLVMAWADGHIDTRAVLRNWAVVAAANLVGCVGMAILVWLSGHLALNDGQVGHAALRIAVAKAQLPAGQAFIRGVLCNALVCLAVWMGMAGRSVVDKVTTIVLPVTVFVAAGFEHSIANLYFFALAILAGAPLGLADVMHNLLPVLAGNLVGGSVFVGGVYFIVYARAARRGSTFASTPGPKIRSIPRTMPFGPARGSMECLHCEGTGDDDGIQPGNRHPARHP
jgi:formate/nitrite transporter